jgi:hypothetical protein
MEYYYYMRVPTSAIPQEVWTILATTSTAALTAIYKFLTFGNPLRHVWT